MRRINRFTLALAALFLTALACNIPQGQAPAVSNPNLAFTAAAQTVAAQLTLSAPQPAASTSTTIPLLPTNTLVAGAPTLPPPAPTIQPPTALPTATQECNKAQFIDDITYEDGAILPQGQIFTKTWRLKNIGTCSWTPSYAVVFHSGEQMSGPNVQALSGNINPGQTVDISVNLKSPGSNGSYTGYWKLRDASGVTFTQFYVQIKVQGGGGGPQVASLIALAAESGMVRSDGVVNAPMVAGDNPSNLTVEAFLSFDISSIPAGSTITKVVVDFSNFDMLGNPFSLSDGCVRAYTDNYGTLNPADFFPGDPLGAVSRWCSTGELATAAEDADMAAAVQARVGAARFQLRIQFRLPTTNSNGIADMVRFYNPKLIITYLP